jgi:hypothetical protein
MKMLTMKLSLLALTLPGCHLFAPANIPCTSSELPECAEGDADADSDADSDTDADTDSDSDTDPIAGVALLEQGGVGSTINVFGPDSSLVYRYEYGGEIVGSIAWSSAAQTAAVGWKDTMAYISGTTLVYGTTYGANIADVATAGTVFFVLVEGGLYLSSPTLNDVLVRPGTFANASSVFLTDDLTLAYIIDHGSSSSGGPTLWAYPTDTGSLYEVFPSYDTTRARSVDGFLGPNGEPYVCSSAGGVYSVEDIFNTVDNGDGKSVPPARIASESPTDITDCGYDSARDEVIMVSRSKGVLRVGPDSATTLWIDLPEGQAIVSGASF